MSAAAGVRVTRELLEALGHLSDAIAHDHLTRPTGSRSVALFAAALSAEIAAALASDAGTPEGEPFFHRIGCPKISGRGTAAHCTCPREMRAMTDAEMSASQAAPLDESGAAAPDAELEELFVRHKCTFIESPKLRAAIHAHVERVKREALEQALHTAASTRSCNFVPAPAPAPGDASGETAADFESALDAYRDELMSNTRVGASGGLRALEPDRTELRRLYRAATGEVVATGTVTGRRWEGGPVPRFATVSLTVGDASRLPLGATVSVVLRRDKEGV